MFCLWDRAIFSRSLLMSSPCLQTPGSEFGNDSEVNVHGHRGLSSRVSVTSHGSGGFSVKDGVKTRKTSLASAAFSHSLINLTQVREVVQQSSSFLERSCNVHQ